jgi:hypothetical protein
METKLQQAIVRGLKASVFEGLPVIFASVPHRAFDAVRVEKEMTGRVEHVTIPFWSQEELEGIAGTGFAALNVRVESSGRHDARRSELREPVSHAGLLPPVLQAQRCPRDPWGRTHATRVKLGRLL